MLQLEKYFNKLKDGPRGSKVSREYFVFIFYHKFKEKVKKSCRFRLFKYLNRMGSLQTLQFGFVWWITLSCGSWNNVYCGNKMNCSFTLTNMNDLYSYLVFSYSYARIIKHAVQLMNLGVRKIRESWDPIIISSITPCHPFCRTSCHNGCNVKVVPLRAKWTPPPPLGPSPTLLVMYGARCGVHYV